MLVKTCKKFANHLERKHIPKRYYLLFPCYALIRNQVLELLGSYCSEKT